MGVKDWVQKRITANPNIISKFKVSSFKGLLNKQYSNESTWLELYKKEPFSKGVSLWKTRKEYDPNDNIKVLEEKMVELIRLSDKRVLKDKKHNTTTGELQRKMVVSNELSKTKGYQLHRSLNRLFGK